VRSNLESLFRRPQANKGGGVLRISVSLPAQTLDVYDDGRRIRRYSVSTAKNGPGENFGSYCTPRGHHVVRAKIGADCAANTVFVGRRPTGEVWTEALAEGFPGRDWMLTRLLWLSGKQIGRNRLGRCDTMRRYIYIHGSPDSATMGIPGSIGCVRMNNRDIIELFDLVPVLCRVDIDDFHVRAGNWTDLRPAAAPIREQVFVLEQGVPKEIELDEFDETSVHAVAYDGCGNAIGTGRLLDDGHIGRMAVSAGWRGLGVGRALLLQLMDEAKARDYSELRLNAQIHAADFYRAFGFAQIGVEFMEAGISHVEMGRLI
jgi:predicted GNAT family N-acyltransferase